MSVDLQTYLRQFSPNTNSSKEWVLQCPICGRDKLVVNIEKGLWHCWVCQRFKIDPFSGGRKAVQGAGNLVQLVALLEGIEVKEAYKKYKSFSSIGFYLSREEKRTKVFPHIPFPDFAKRITQLLPYCQERGITLEDVYTFGLFFCDAGKYKNRLIFPVWQNGGLIFYQGRLMGDYSVKALNPPKFVGSAGAEDTLFNLELASSFSEVVITEGPIDAIHVGHNAVGSWGKHLTINQAMALFDLGVRNIVLLWDGPSKEEPEGAFNEMVHTALSYSTFFDSIKIGILEEGDPGQYSRDYLKKVINSAKSVDFVSRLNRL